jgi:YD repeat-containing protein
MCGLRQLGRMTSQTDTFGDVTSSTYDKGGNVKTRTDAKGKVTTMVYDAQNRLKTTTDRLGGVTTNNYNCCRLASIVDAEGQMTSYIYNTRGEKIKETHPDHVNGSAVGTSGYGIVEFLFDEAGRLKRKTDQAGDTCTFNYDLAGRMLQRNYRTLANSPSGTIADSDVFTFDKANRMLTAASGRYTNTVTQVYDPLGRHQQEKLTIAGQTYTTTHDFDSLGRPFKMTYPDGTITEKTFTDRGQLYQTKYAGNIEDTRTYDDGGRLSTSAYRNGVTTTYAYRANGSQKDNLLASISFAHPAGATANDQVGNLTYTWDANKNKTKETITGVMSGYSFDTTVGTDPDGYDDEDRLTYFKRTSTANPQTWNLSLVGDWNSWSDFGATQNRTHGPTHELLTVGSAPNNTVTHDVKGNMTDIPVNVSSPARKLFWDFDNQLKGVDITGDNLVDVTFEYDATGRRVARTEGSNAVVFIQSGQQTIADYTRGAPSSSTPSSRYIWGSRTNEVIVRQSAISTLNYFHFSQQFSVVALTDFNGFVTERYAYSAMGNPTLLDASASVSSFSDSSNRYTFNAQEWDHASSLFFANSKINDPRCANVTRVSNQEPVPLAPLLPAKFRKPISCNGDEIGEVEFEFKKFDQRDRLDNAVLGIQIEGGFKQRPNKDFTLKPCCCDDIRWIQYVTTNAPKPKNSKTNPRVNEGLESSLDGNGGIGCPFYYCGDPGDPKQNENGFTRYFFDRPARSPTILHSPFFGAEDNWPETIPTLIWRAKLALVCVSACNLDSLAVFEYGFEIDRATNQLKLSEIKDSGIDQIFTTLLNDFPSCYQWDSTRIGKCCK